MPDETQPLLGGDTRPSRSRLSRYLQSDLDPHRGDLILLYCYIITGLLDSSAVFIWGSFVSMQTGNTVYLGLGLASQTSRSKHSAGDGGGGGSGGDRWIKSGISIASFC